MQAGQDSRSLSDVHGSVPVARYPNVLRRIFAVAGPAFLVAVGYMDPGNWATDLAAGSRYEYRLIWVLLMSNGMALLLQSLAARLGVVRGLDLAQACRVEYGRAVRLALYGLCEVAITACDLAEVLGSAIALQLLFGLPLLWGVLITAADTLALLFLSHLGIRKIEALILGLITIIGVGFLVQVVLARPDWGAVAGGFVPHLPDAAALFIAIGIIGATVMPHNLYLHSALVQTREIGPSDAQKRQAIRFNSIDSFVALNLAFLVNSAILIVAAAVFYRSGHREVADIQDAHQLLAPLIGSTVAPIAFALALLASGQSSTITGTLAGQIVMEGFLNVRVPPWIRRMITRLLAIAPAVAMLWFTGESGTGPLLVLSQVVLSLQLPFAVVPLIHFVSDRSKMGAFAIGRWTRVAAWACAAVIVALNAWLAVDAIGDWAATSGASRPWILGTAIPAAVALAGLLLYVAARPWLAGLARRPAVPAVGVHGPAPALDLRLGVGGPAVPYGKVAIALDFSGRDADVIGSVLRFLGAQRPELALMHVVESAAARFLGGASGDVESRRDAERLEAYAAQLRSLGFPATVSMGAGKPVPELERMVKAFGAELLVVGAHGHRFLSDLVFGATADRLRHRVDATVLVVASRPEAGARTPS